MADRTEKTPAGQRRKIPWLLLGEILAAAVIGALLFAFRAGGDLVTLTFYTPGNRTETKTVFSGALVELPQGPDMEGYAFRGWRDSQGSLELRRSVRVYEDTAWAAVYAMPLETKAHMPYLKLRNGCFRPTDALTRREAVEMFYTLLNRDLTGAGRFADLPENDELYPAAATLKDLGVLRGQMLHPEDPLLRGELLEWLGCFFPPQGGSVRFSDLDGSSSWYGAFRTAALSGWIESGEDIAARPEEPVTRLETAQILNRALGRCGDSVRELENFPALGTIADVSRKDPRYGDVAEAVLVHAYEDKKLGRELWTQAEPIPSRPEGFFFDGVRLHYIGSDGDPAIGCEARGLRFDENGVFTTGMPELDAYLFEVLESRVDPAKMKQKDMLRILYEYVVTEFFYMNRSQYQPGETGWAEEEAYVMFTKGSGNCYNYAAVFYELARAIGCDARIYSGTISSGRPPLDSDGTKELLPEFTAHGWVEINLDGEFRLFDPDMEMANRGYLGSGAFFDRSQEFMRRYAYKHE